MIEACLCSQPGSRVPGYIYTNAWPCLHLCLPRRLCLHLTKSQYSDHRARIRCLSRFVLVAGWFLQVRGFGVDRLPASSVIGALRLARLGRTSGAPPGSVSATGRPLTSAIGGIELRKKEGQAP